MAKESTSAGLDGSPSWAEICAEFPIACRKIPLIDGASAPLLYLDHAASTHAPRSVLDRYTRFMADEYANIHRGVYQLSADATRRYDAVRARVAQLQAASP